MNKLDEVNAELKDIQNRKLELYNEYVQTCEKRIRILLEEYGLYEGMDVYFPIREKKTRCKLDVRFKNVLGTSFQGHANACATPYKKNGELGAITYLVGEYEYYKLERVEDEAR